MQEDLLDTQELLGTDFSHLALYVHMAYGEQAYGGYLWMEATATQEAG